MKLDGYLSDRQKKRRKRRQYVFFTSAAFLGYFLFAGLGWLVFRSPFSRVERVVVTGNVSVPEDRVVSLLESKALADHGFIKALLGFGNMFAWPGALPPADLTMVPQLAAISISKDYFSNTLTATVTERQPFGVWCFVPRAAEDAVIGTKQCFWFDGTGILFERAPETEGSLLLTVHDSAQRPAGLNQKILPDAFAANMISAMNVVRGSGLHVADIVLSDLAREEVTVRTGGGPDVYFSLRFPADNYLTVIKELMSQKGFSKLQYIDCRTENRVYYK